MDLEENTELLLDTNFEYYKELAFQVINSSILNKLEYKIILGIVKSLTAPQIFFMSFSIQKCREGASLATDLLLQRIGENYHEDIAKVRRKEWNEKINTKE